MHLILRYMIFSHGKCHTLTMLSVTCTTVVNLTKQLWCQTRSDAGISHNNYTNSALKATNLLLNDMHDTSSLITFCQPFCGSIIRCLWKHHRYNSAVHIQENHFLGCLVGERDNFSCKSCLPQYLTFTHPNNFAVPMLTNGILNNELVIHTYSLHKSIQASENHRIESMTICLPWCSRNIALYSISISFVRKFKPLFNRQNK